MSVEANLELAKAYFGTHDANYFAVDAEFRDMSMADPLHGREAIAAMLRMFYVEAFSAAHAEVRRLVADAHSVAAEFVFHGTHTGNAFGLPPTGHRVRLPMSAVYEIEGGEIRRARLYYDTAALARQLRTSLAVIAAS